jgi:hypothetical protein
MAKRSSKAQKEAAEETNKVETPIEVTDETTVTAEETTEEVTTQDVTEAEVVAEETVVEETVEEAVSQPEDQPEEAPAAAEEETVAEVETTEVTEEVAPEQASEDTIEDAEIIEETVTEEVTEATVEEPASAPEPEVAAAQETPAPVVTEKVIERVERKGGFFPMLFGGVAAAAIGFGVTTYMYQVGPFAADVAAEEDNSTAQMQSDLGALSDRLNALENAAAPEMPEVPDLAPVTASVSGLTDQLGALTGQIGGLGEQLTALDTRLTALEQRPIEAASDAAVSSFEDAVAGLRQEIEDQRVQIEDMAAEAVEAEKAAEETSRQALARAAMTRLQSSLDAGTPFAPALSDLQGVSAVEVPATLSTLAEDGIPSLAQLQASYPDYARDALGEARALTAEGDTQERLGAFLLNQLGARSLEPKEGDSADAVLSRAEAAVKDARLSDALSEISALPEAARAAMAPWVEQAQLRQDALAAAETLSQNLNSN